MSDLTTDLPRHRPDEYTDVLTRSGVLYQYVQEHARTAIDAQVSELRQLAADYAENEYIVDNYAMALIEVVVHQPLSAIPQAVGESRRLAAMWPDNWRINSSHACVLTNAIVRSVDQDPAALLTEFIELADHFGHDNFFDQRLSIAVKALVNRQQVDVTWGLAWLRSLACAHADNKITVKNYLAAVLDRTAADSQASRQLEPELESFLSQHPYLPIARTMLAKVLYNQIVDQIVTDPPAWDKLAALVRQYPQDPEMTRWYAEGVAQTTVWFEPAGRQWAVGVLTDLARNRPDDQKIGYAYARGLFNLSLTQAPQDQWGSVQQLRYVVGRFPDHQIALLLAKALFNIAKLQTGPTRASLQAELSALAARYPHPEDIEKLSKGLAATPLPGTKGKHRG